MEAAQTPPTAPEHNYPLTFSVDYPERDLNRLTTFFRVFTVIPIAIILGAVSGGSFGGNWGGEGGKMVIAAGGLLVFAPLLMILFRQKYPAWWANWNRE